MNNVRHMNNIPLRKYNRVLFSRKITLPAGLPGGDSNDLGFIYNLGRVASWNPDKGDIIGELQDLLIDLTIEFQEAQEAYAAEWRGTGGSSGASLRAAAALQRLERDNEKKAYDIGVQADRRAAAYLIERVEGPFDSVLPQGDKPDTWKLLDPMIVAWLVHPKTLEGVLQELTDPLATRPSMQQLRDSMMPDDEPLNMMADEADEPSIPL